MGGAPSIAEFRRRLAEAQAWCVRLDPRSEGVDAWRSSALAPAGLPADSIWFEGEPSGLATVANRQRTVEAVVAERSRRLRPDGVPLDPAAGLTGGRLL